MSSSDLKAYRLHVTPPDPSDNHMGECHHPVERQQPSARTPLSPHDHPGPRTSTDSVGVRQICHTHTSSCYVARHVRRGPPSSPDTAHTRLDLTRGWVVQALGGEVGGGI